MPVCVSRAVGRVALRLRRVLRVEAGAKLVQQRRRKHKVVRKRQAFVDLRRVVRALQRAAGLGAIGKRAKRPKAP